jgi:signal peptidase II
MFFGIAIATIICDQLSKWIIVHLFSSPLSLPVIPSVFHLTLVYNRGAAFGLFPGAHLFFIGISLCVVAGILYYRKSLLEEGFYSVLGYALILGGAIGNLIDRIRLKAVIDFLDFRIWPVFNIADSAICVGVFFLILCFLFSFKKAQ